MRAILTAIVLTTAALVLPSAQTSGYKPTPENLASRKWFQEARFGLFVHWGIYSQLADGEWVGGVQSLSYDAKDNVGVRSAMASALSRTGAYDYRYCRLAIP